MKRGGFGLGPTGKSPEDIEREAAAELRRAMAGSEPKPQFRGGNMPSDWIGNDDEDEMDPGGSEWRVGLTRDEERRAVTDLAMQQLTERPIGKIRPLDTVTTSGLTDAEDMRNRALAQFLQRQQKMDRENPAPKPKPGTARAGQPVTQRTSGITVSPRLTVAPTLTGNRPAFPPSLEKAVAELAVSPQLGPKPAATTPAISAGGWDRPAKPKRASPRAAWADVTANGAHPSPALAAPSPALAAPPETSAPPETADHLETSDQPAPSDPTATAGGLRAPGSRPERAPTRSPGEASPAVRTRPVRRRSGGRPTPGSGDSGGRWQALAELADLLAGEAFPGDALPEAARWLAETVGATISILLVSDDGVDDVLAWPPDDPVTSALVAQVGRPFDERSSIWIALADEQTVSGTTGDELLLPDGERAGDTGGWAVIPIVDRGVAFGAILAASTPGDELSEATVALVDEVAQRVARALFNCEEVASHATAPDGGLPDAVRNRLGALAFVLDAAELGPGVRLPPGYDRRYAEVTQHAAILLELVSSLLSEDDGVGR